MINELEPIKAKWKPLDQKMLKVLPAPPWMSGCCCQTRLGQYSTVQAEIKSNFCTVALDKALHNIISKSFNAMLNTGYHQSVFTSQAKNISLALTSI